MKMKLNLLAGMTALASVSCAHAQTSGNYPIKDANSTVRQRAAASLPDGSLADKHVLVDSTGVEKGTVTNPMQMAITGAVTTALPAGAATASGVAAVVTALGSPLQAGGTVNLGTGGLGSSGNPLYVTGGPSGSSVPTGTAGSPNSAVVSMQGVAGGIAVPIVGTVTANLGTIAGSATSALQASGNSSLTAISAQLPASLGAKASVGSLSIAPATDATFAISAAALPLPTGAATASAQAINTAAITGSQAATGTLAATSTTVTTTLPQIAATPGLAISFGTTAATLFNANASRHFVQIQVQGSTGGCYINGTATATADANSLYLAAGSYFESATHVGTGAISIICTSAATPVYSRQG